MLKNYLKTAIRNISRNFGYSLLNFLGLSLGISLFILISIYVINEYSYDRFNKNYNRIYRFEEGDAESVHLPSAMGLDAQDWFPEIEKVVRFKPWGSVVLHYEDKSFKIPQVKLADSSFFDVFTTHFIKGNPKKVFEAPNSIVLTEKIAQIFFGDEDPVGKILKTTNNFELVVQGVIKNFPDFHIQIDALIPFNLLGVINSQEYLRSYGTWQFQTYFLLPENINYKNLEQKLETRFTKLFAEQEDEVEKVNLTLRPLKDVYFAHHTISDFGMIHANKNNVDLFLSIGIFIILIACINFINLTTAKAASRATEVGIRKVHGGQKRQLIFQFLSETILIIFISFLLAITIVQLVLPLYNNLIQKELILADYIHFSSILGSVVFILLTGIISGIYPAFYLTSYKTVSVLKGEKTKGKGAALLRRLLIILQFTISAILISSTFIIQDQLKFLRTTDMGFNKEHIVNVPLNSKIREQKETFKEKLLSNPKISSVSFSSGFINSMSNNEAFDFNSDGNHTGIQLHSVDPGFIKLFEIELIEGRNFSFDKATDKKQKIILNEEAVKAGGLEKGKAAGTIFYRDGWYFTALPSKECEVIGVIKNYNYRPLYEKVGAMGLCWNDDWHGLSNIKIEPGNMGEAIEIIEEIFKEFSPEVPFEFSFVDENIDKLYISDKRLGKLFNYFAAIAIIIAVLGLFGLASYMVTSRTKEIGIRKVLGSSVSNIFLILSKEFFFWVLIANIIAIPVAVMGMNKWLTSFAYKTTIKPWFFVITIILSLFITFITILYQALKAARSNPAHTLRYE